MACIIAVRGKKDRLVAKVIDGESSDGGSCAFCNKSVNDELLYGKLYSIGDIYCHYFCVLLSCCLIQKGNDEEGLLGFLYSDIKAELERSKKHRCSYCGKGGATLGCCASQCRKQFHLPCGRDRKSVSMFFGNYKSFCVDHAPEQKISSEIAAKAKTRKAEARRQARVRREHNSKLEEHVSLETELLCVICYEEVDAFPTPYTFWPPCCARDAWLHRTCLERMALSAGMHYLKCPLCNDKATFCKAVVNQGYYVPDRDASWELEQNAFSEIYERRLRCDAPVCNCPKGREYDAEQGIYDIQFCILCGSTCAHVACMENIYKRYTCGDCIKALPNDASLEETVDALIKQEQLEAQKSSPQKPTGPIMPSRMSIRRTKQNVTFYNRSTAVNRNVCSNRKTEVDETKSDSILRSRLELNLKTPKRMQSTIQNDTAVSNTVLSPMKMLKQQMDEKMKCLDLSNDIGVRRKIEEMREKLTRPTPFCVKKRIVNNTLEEICNQVSMEKQKYKSPKKAYFSPKKEFGLNYNDTFKENEDSKSNYVHTENDFQTKTYINIKKAQNLKRQSSNMNEVSPKKKRLSLNRNIDVATKNTDSVIDVSNKIEVVTNRFESVLANKNESTVTALNKTELVSKNIEASNNNDNAFNKTDTNNDVALNKTEVLTKKVDKSSNIMNEIYIDSEVSSKKNIPSSIWGKKYLNEDTSVIDASSNKIENPSNKVDSPLNKLKPPSNKLKSPLNLLKSPSNKLKSPSNKLKSPPNKLKSPPNKLKPPSNKLKSPSNKLKSPSNKLKSPSNMFDTLSNNIESSQNKLKSPSNMFESLSNKIKTPSNKIKSPQNNLKSPSKTFESPSNKFETPSINFVTPSNKLETSSNKLETQSNQTIISPKLTLKFPVLEKDSSMEISTEQESVSVDFIKMQTAIDIKEYNNSNTKCVKFSPKIDKLYNKTDNIDIENFKSQYLNEIGQKCFNHTHLKTDSKTSRLQSAIDFAVDATNKKKKKKKHKKKNRKSPKIQIKNANFDLKSDFHVSINWKKDELNVKIGKNKRKKSKKRNLKQKLLNFSPESEPLTAAPISITPKRKKIKNKPNDSMKQLSLHSFFKKTP